jgi:hypothetical protein
VAVQSCDRNERVLGRGKRLEALEESLREQVRVLVQTGSVKNPHPYFRIWLMCRNLQGDAMNRLFPDEGGVLDQDWTTVWSFEILDNAYQEEQSIKTNLEQNKDKLEELRQNLLRSQ